MTNRRVQLAMAAIGVVVIVLALVLVIGLVGPTAMQEVAPTLLPTLPPVVQPTATTAPVVVSGASIALAPAEGGPGVQVSVTGAGFPPNTLVTIHVGPPDAGAPAEPYAEIMTDAAGAFVVSFMMPETWADGTPITGPQVVVVASSPDGSATASADFGYGGPLMGMIGTPGLTGDLATYTNDELGVSFQYPATWTEVPNEIGRYSGPDGYFAVQAAGPDGMTLDEVCAAEVATEGAPYGAAPTVTTLTIAGQPACLIMGSEDAPTDVSALVVTYPAPVSIAGVDYSVFVLYADAAHIQAIGQTLVFTITGAPVIVITATP